METLITGHYKNTATVNIGNTGDGTVSTVTAVSTAPTEIWTLTCTVAALDGGTFSVVGSISGAKADLTVAVAYDNSIIALTIADGLTDWIVGDSATLDIVREVNYNTPTPSSSSRKIDTIEASFTGDVTEFTYGVDGSLGTSNSYVIEASKTLSAGELTAGGTIYLSTNAVSASKIVVSGLVLTATTEATFEVLLETT